MIRKLSKKMYSLSAFFKGLTVKHDLKTIEKIGKISGANFENSRERYIMRSPNGEIEVILSSTNELKYQVFLGGETVIDESPLGIVSKGINLGSNVLISEPHQSQTDDTYRVIGKHSKARDLNNSYLFPLKHLDTTLEYYIEFMLWNDGIGFRYIFQEGTKLYVSEEKTQFNLPVTSVCWYQTDPSKLQAKTVKQETRYLLPDITIACLVTFQLADDKGYVMLTESNIRNYPGCAFKTNDRGTLQVEFWDTKKFFSQNCVSPWRLAIICKDLDSLTNNDVVTNSAPAPSRKYLDTSYIKPGKSAWSFFVEGDDYCSFDTIMRYNKEIEKTKLTEYNLIDDSWKKWGLTEIGAFIKLKKVVKDANNREVGIWVWKAMTDGLYFGFYRRWFFDQCVKVGVKGIKIDLIESETPFQINLYRKILKETADRKLMVIFHNPQKPTGLERTFPNLLTMEAIRGVQNEIDPDDSTILPFTRLAVSGADFTPCCLSDKELLPRGTWTHMMATSVIMYSPFLSVADSPQKLSQTVFADFIKNLPTTWSKSICLPQSRIGEVAIFARKHGNNWYVAALNSCGGKREIEVLFDFLDEDRQYIGQAFFDNPENRFDSIGKKIKVVHNNIIRINMEDGGGFLTVLYGQEKVIRYEQENNSNSSN